MRNTAAYPVDSALNTVKSVAGGAARKHEGMNVERFGDVLDLDAPRSLSFTAFTLNSAL